ncbi:T9SS type A sorting domain-containing protein [Chryseobacterium daeguense]|uniref:T9SS type A sorting domain-containing protein n=1 Tax=Chryseobacterium daeguense TaxID=412438 RepID=UPI0009D658D7|nr:T9SS type A sorting domain-containing protein [Chryseobacterium daeguense]
MQLRKESSRFLQRFRTAIRNPGTSFAGHYWDDAVWEPIPSLGTSETDLHAGIKVYPNPFKDVLNISETKDVKKAVINDAVGRIIRTIENPSETLEVSDLQKGVYFITLHFKNGTEKSFKAIKN